MKERLADFRNVLLGSCLRHYAQRLVSLAVFGSWAREAATPQSDIDVLLVARDLPDGRLKRVAEFEEVETETLVARRNVWPEFKVASEISPVVKTPEEVAAGSPLFLDMTCRCDILFDRDRFLEQYLRGLGARMAALGSTRHARKGGYYWEYKPGIRPAEVVSL